MHLLRIIYRSKINRSYTADADQIALAAGRFNAQNRITGCLFQTGDFYYQILEGPREAVLNLLEKIEADYRHSQVTVLESSKIDKRNFPSWSMGALSHYEVAQIFGTEAAGIKQPKQSFKHDIILPNAADLLNIFSTRVGAILTVFDQHMVTQLRTEHG
jgi:hypothetical protein